MKKQVKKAVAKKSEVNGEKVNKAGFEKSKTRAMSLIKKAKEFILLVDYGESGESTMCGPMGSLMRLGNGMDRIKAQLAISAIESLTGMKAPEKADTSCGH